MEAMRIPQQHELWLPPFKQILLQSTQNNQSCQSRAWTKFQELLQAKQKWATAKGGIKKLSTFAPLHISIRWIFPLDYEMLVLS